MSNMRRASPPFTACRSRADDLHSLLDELDPAAAKWYNLGLALGVRSGRLDAIKVDYGTVDDNLREMLKAWLSTADRPTWEQVATALESRPVAKGSLARGVRETYCVTARADPR